MLGCLSRGNCKKINKMLKPRFLLEHSGDLKSDHLKSRNIGNQDFLKVGLQTVRTSCEVNKITSPRLPWFTLNISKQTIRDWPVVENFGSWDLSSPPPHKSIRIPFLCQKNLWLMYLMLAAQSTIFFPLLLYTRSIWAIRQGLLGKSEA